MTRQLYSERFPKYAEAFEWAWERYQKGEKPTWHHWWLQRYLQISPSYYEYTLINENLAAQFKEQHQLITYLMRMCSSLSIKY